MKLHLIGLDDLHNELEYLCADGGPLARLVLTFSRNVYRLHHAVLMRLLRRKWPSRTSFTYPPIGLFNLDPADIESAWRA
jgi:hypothetical protein